MSKIILATVRSIINALEYPHVALRMENNGFKVFFMENLEPPFPFDTEFVYALVTGLKKLGREEFRHFPNLKLATPFGTGYDHIDCEAAKARGIIVTHVPALNSRSVAEHTIACILALAKNLRESDGDMKKGIWQRNYSRDFSGKKLGIIGLGNVGKKVAAMAADLGMMVSVYDIKYDEEFLSRVPLEKKEFNDIISSSDIISLHVPLTNLTRRFINRDSFKAMRKGVYLINTARGEVVDEEALLEALDKEKIAGAALDVFPEEPPHRNLTLKKIICHPKVLATPHVAAFTRETHYAVAMRILDNICALREGRLESLDRVV